MIIIEHAAEGRTLRASRFKLGRVVRDLCMRFARLSREHFALIFDSFGVTVGANAEQVGRRNSEREVGSVSRIPSDQKWLPLFVCGLRV